MSSPDDECIDALSQELAKVNREREELLVALSVLVLASQIPNLSNLPSARRDASALIEKLIRREKR